MNQQRHEMFLGQTHSSGAEEWNCPTCGRRMTITWQPWRKIILEPGDVYAAHSGSKGPMKTGPLQFNLEDKDAPATARETSFEDPYLAPWERWLDKMDLDDLGEDETE